MNDPWVMGSLVGLGLGTMLFLLRAVTMSGAVVGAGLCCIFVGSGGVVGFTGFALLVLGGSGATAVGGARKRWFEKGERVQRGGGQALANAGVGAACLLTWPEGGLAPALAALSAAFADTMSSEIGLLSRRAPRLLLFGPRTLPGRDGAMTPLGTFAGVLAAGVAAGLAAIHDWGLFAPVFLGGVAGTLADSVLGLSVEPHLPRRWGNDVVNGLATAVGAGVALLLGAG